MSYANQDIHNAAGPGSSAEPSMEEILASIRRILKEDEPGKPAEPAKTDSADPIIMSAAAAPLDIDDDVLVLDESMIAKPADFSSATTLPADPIPATEHPTTPLAPAGEALHVSSEPLPFAGDDEFARAIPEQGVDLPETIDEQPQPLPDIHAGPTLAAVYEPEAPEAQEPDIILAAWPAWPPRPADTEPDRLLPERARLWDALPAEPEASITSDAPEPDHTPIVAATALDSTPEPETWHAPEPAPPAEPHAEPLAQNEPEHNQEPEMNDTAENAFQPPESLISDKTTDAAASSIGALVRSMTAEKSVAISKGSSITIEDIVRDEIRPLHKSWLDSHLPSLVERVVRTEIERVINRSVV